METVFRKYYQYHKYVLAKEVWPTKIYKFATRQRTIEKLNLEPHFLIVKFLNLPNKS